MTSLQQSVLLLCIGLLMALPSQAQLLKKVWKKHKEPQISCQTRWDYNISESGKPGIRYRAAVRHYNELGKPSSWVRFDEDGNPQIKYDYRYKDTSVKRVWYTPSGEVRSDYVEQYNKQGQLIRYTRYTKSGSVLDRRTFEYDAEGRKIREEYLNEALEPIFVNTFSYDDKRYVVKEHYNDLINDESYVAIIQHNIDWKPLSYTRYKASGPVDQKVLYKQDEYGRIINTETYKEGKILSSRNSYTYDSTGMLDSFSLFIIEDGEERLVERSEYEYEYF